MSHAHSNDYTSSHRPSDTSSDESKKKQESQLPNVKLDTLGLEGMSRGKSHHVNRRRVEVDKVSSSSSRGNKAKVTKTKSRD